MLVAVLADIHANNLALQKVLDDCRALGIERFVVLGDSIGYYYWPAEVLIALENTKEALIIQGNHERMFGNCQQNPQSFGTLDKRYQRGMQAARDRLDENQKNFLLSLPASRRLTIDGVDCLLSHGSPQDQDCYVYPDASNELLDACARTGAEFSFTGHTHYPFVGSRNNTTIVNPGSVGQPRDIGALASYAILNTNNRTIVHRRVAFDYERLLAKAVEEDDPNIEYLRKLMGRGRGNT